MTGREVARKARPSGRDKRISDLSVVTTIESPGEIPRSGHRPASEKVIGEAAETQTAAAPARDRVDRRERKTPPAYGGAVMGIETAGCRRVGIHRLQAVEDVKIIHAVSPRTSRVRRPIDGSVQGPRCGRDGLARSRRPGPSRPTVAPPRYYGAGVAMSVVPHHRRPVTVATTVGLALVAGMITLWLGLVANVGQMINGNSARSAARLPDRLAVVRVEPRESLEDVAHRVAPDAPARQVAERIRELNDLNSPTLVAGQTLIAPVG